MNNKKNLATALINQAVAIIYGLILPRVIIGTFGSEINGMVSSITQFLSFISLLEGGLGAVVLAELYSPIETRDYEHIKNILCACQKFFIKLTAVFIIYSIVVAVVYSFSMKGKYSFAFTSSLVFILSLSTIAQYLLSITNKLILQAEQKIYIINIVTTITLISNLIIALIVIAVYPEIHLLKIGASIAFFVQPFIFRKYVSKVDRFSLKDVSKCTYALKDRWSGFGQNLAHFINMNTDIAVITVFVGLTSVSVYSVYMLAINALRSVVSTADNSYQSALGKYYVEDSNLLYNKFKSFNKVNCCVSLILYSTCLLLINPFVALYTSGVTDASYYEPAFALIMVLANLMYCIREPFRLVVLASGMFKETNVGSAIEAIINIVVSLLLVRRLGLLGVAIGTLIAIVYRLLYFIVFLKKDVLFMNYKEYIVPTLKTSIVIVINILGYFLLNLKVTSFLGFFCLAVIVFVIEVLFVGALFFGAKGLAKTINSFLISRK